MRHLATTRRQEKQWLITILLVSAATALCLLAVFILHPDRQRLGQFDPVMSVPKTHALWRTLPAERYLPVQHSILYAAWEHDLDPDLIRAVILIESRYDAKAVSPVGASGMMQIMPGTAADMGLENLFDPHDNILAGSKYLRLMLDWFEQDIDLALAAYNAGPGTVIRYGGLPPYKETINYVKKVKEIYHSLSQGEDEV